MNMQSLFPKCHCQVACSFKAGPLTRPPFKYNSTNSKSSGSQESCIMKNTESFPHSHQKTIISKPFSKYNSIHLKGSALWGNLTNECAKCLPVVLPWSGLLFYAVSNFKTMNMLSGP